MLTYWDYRQQCGYLSMGFIRRRHYCREPAATAGARRISGDAICRATGRRVDICRRPDMRQLDWYNHVTTFDAVRMRVGAVPARRADWQTMLAGTMPRQSVQHKALRLCD